MGSLYVQSACDAIAKRTLDRTATAREPFAQALTFTYDPVGNRTVVQDSQSGVTTSTYDAANRLTAREFGGVGQTKLKWENSYTNRDQLSVETRYRWTGSAWASIGTSEYSYDDAMRVTNIKHKDGGGTIQANFTYTYDSADRVTSAIDNGAAVSYSYDNTNQLTADGTASYSYDANGNRTMAGYATSTGNRTTNDGTWTYTFDDAGNEIKKSKGASAETWNYLYDHRNQLIAAEKHASDGGTLLAKVLNKYDALGDRIERDEDADGNGTYETVERFAFDGWKVHQDAGGGQAGFIGQENFDVWADLNGSNVLTTRRLFGDAIDQIVARINSGGTAAWYYQDRLGSVRNLVDATGTLQETLTYDGFGNILTDSNPTFGDRYKYTAREWDSLTKLQGNRARWYDPATGKWMAQDPEGFDTQDANLYRYVHNIAALLKDPSGLADFELRAVNVAPPVAGKWGGFVNLTRWSLTPAKPKDQVKGGVIIQYVHIHWDVKRSDGSEIDKTTWPKFFLNGKGNAMPDKYYEAWAVNPNGIIGPPLATLPTDLIAKFRGLGWSRPLPTGMPFNDFFGLPIWGQNTQGRFSIDGEARYFDGLDLDDLEKKFNFFVRTDALATPARGLPSLPGRGCRSYNIFNHKGDFEKVQDLEKLWGEKGTQPDSAVHIVTVKWDRHGNTKVQFEAL